MSRVLLIICTICLLCAAASAQQATPTPKKPVTPVTPPVPAASFLKSSAAYAEVILRKTELEADLESMLLEYTEEYPKVEESRIEIDLLQKEIERLGLVKSADAGRLTAALGKIIVKKVGVEVDLVVLKLKYNDKHPDVLSAKKKVDIFDKAIKDILGF